MDKTAQAMLLIDGRKLGFAEYGDFSGKPVFYFHGWPSSRLGAEKYHSIAKKFHVRIIAPDRPGYGLSDFQKDRRLLNWPNDVAAIANHLQIKKFSVMGVSGGGPYAAVCAYKIPERITKTAIIVGLAPIFSWEALNGMAWMSKIGWANFGKHPIIRTISSFIQYANATIGPSFGLHRYFMGSKTDRQLYRDSTLRQSAARNTREAFRGGIKGPQLDLMLYTSHWGFDLKDIPGHIYLWYGAKDQNVPLKMGKFYEQNVPRRTFKVYPNEGHLISITHAEEILKTLIS